MPAADSAAAAATPRRYWAGRRQADRRARLRAALQRPQALLELPVAVLQLLVLAGELAQLVLELLDSHFRVGIIGLLRERRLSDSASIAAIAAARVIR